MVFMMGSAVILGPNNYAESFFAYEEEALLGLQEYYVMAFCFTY